MNLYRNLQIVLTCIIRIGILLIIGLQLYGCDPFVTLVMRPTIKSQYGVKLSVKKEYLAEDSMLIKMSAHTIPGGAFMAKRLHAATLLPDTVERRVMFLLGGWNHGYFSSVAGVIDTLVITTPTATTTLTDSASVYSYLSSQPLRGLFNHELYIP